MSRTIAVVTPENIKITYRLAGVASRTMAFLVDLFIQLLLIIAVQGALKLVAGGAGKPGVSLASLLSAAGMLLVYLIIFAYAIFFEMLWGGRTPGKRLFHLRVIRDGGYPINLMSSALRNILRFIDLGIFQFAGNPVVLCGLPGLMCIFFSPSYRRIGDYAAGTSVIVDTGSSPLQSGKVFSLTPAASLLLPYIRNLDRVTPQEYRVIRRLTSRRIKLNPYSLHTLSERVGANIIKKLELSVPLRSSSEYINFLEALEHLWAEERGLL